MNDPTIIDIETARRSRSNRHNNDVLADIALDECEKAFRWSDWDRFRHWHTVYLRARRRYRGEDESAVDQLPNRGAAPCVGVIPGPNQKLTSIRGTAMRYGRIGIALLALMLATPVPAQVPSWSLSDHASVIATTTLPSVSSSPTFARLIGGTIWSNPLTVVSSADGFFYQLSGSTQISLNGTSHTLVAGSALYIPNNANVVAKAVGDDPSVYLQFLLADQISGDTPELLNVNSREVYRSPYPVPGLKNTVYVLDLIKVTVPHLASWDAPHHRSGMALHCVLAGVGAENANGITTVRGPGSISFEPSELIYQWSNPGNAPLTYLVFNLNPQNEQAVVWQVASGVRPE